MVAAEVVAAIPFLRALRVRDRERLRAAASLRRLARGALVFREGDGTSAFTFVTRGRVKLLKTASDGVNVIIQTPGPGHLVCLGAVSGSAPYCCTCTAMEDGTEVIDVPRSLLTAVLDSGNGAARSFMCLAAECAVASCQRIEVLGLQTVERRIARLLLRLAEASGVPLRDGAVRVSVALSRQDLAALCCTTAETASRVMSALRRAGIVRTAARGFVVTDPQALRHRAQA